MSTSYSSPPSANGRATHSEFPPAGAAKSDEASVQREVQNEAATNSAAVIAVITAASTAKTPQEAARAALLAVKNAFNWTYGSYWDLSHDARHLAFMVDVGVVNDQFRAATATAKFAEGEGLVGRAWKERGLVYVPSLAAMKGFGRAAAAEAAGLKAAVAFPIIVREKVIATMDFFTTDARALSEGRIEALKSVGLLVSSAMERLLDAERQAESITTARAVNQVLGAVQSARTTSEVIGSALDAVRSAFGWAYGSSYTMDETTRELVFTGDSGSVDDEFRADTMKCRFGKGVGLVGRSWAENTTIYVPELAKLPGFLRAKSADRSGIVAALCFPLCVDGEVVGAMDMFTKSNRGLTEVTLDGLRSLSQIISAALARTTAAEREAAAQAELRRKVDLMLVVVQAAATGDLTKEVPVTGNDAIGQMGDALGKLLGTLRRSMNGIGHNVQTLASAAEELTAVSKQMTLNADATSANAGVVSAASSQVNANVQTVATSAEEMTASIREISKNASEAARIATSAVGVATTTNRTVSKLGDSSAEIGKVIKVITSIAQQTNLLALNATIEAARAGEAGKGFAVVANEVKELAKETAKATEDISQKIEAIQSDTRSAVVAIRDISTIIDQINEIQSTIASAVEEQTATTNEISRNVSEAARGSGEIAQNITGVAKAAQSTSEGAVETQSAATELSRMAAELQALVSQYKA